MGGSGGRSEMNNSCSKVGFIWWHGDKVLMEINCSGKKLHWSYLFFTGYGNSKKHSKYCIFRFLTLWMWACKILAWVYLWAFLPCFIDLHFFLCVCLYHTVLMTVALYYTIWGQGAWFLQLDFSFSRLFWLLGVFFASIQTVKFIVLVLWKNTICIYFFTIFFLLYNIVLVLPYISMNKKKYHV